MATIVKICDLQEEAFNYIGLSAVGIYLVIKYNLIIRQEGKTKSIYFSIVVWVSVIIMYFYYFIKYKVDLLNFENLFLLIYLIVFIYREYVFRVYSLESLEKRYK